MQIKTNVEHGSKLQCKTVQRKYRYESKQQNTKNETKYGNRFYNLTVQFSGYWTEHLQWYYLVTSDECAPFISFQHINWKVLFA